MKLTARSTLRQVVQAVGAALSRHRIRAVLTGGACASLHSGGQYLSTDLDFILQSWVSPCELDEALAKVRFRRDGNRYIHQRTPFYVEFPAGPLAVGDDHALRPIELKVGRTSLLGLSPTDSCRDRLAAFYHWNDRQSLRVAAFIACRHELDLELIRRWSASEGHSDKFERFLGEIRRMRALGRRSFGKRSR